MFLFYSHKPMMIPEDLIRYVEPGVPDHINVAENGMHILGDALSPVINNISEIFFLILTF